MKINASALQEHAGSKDMNLVRTQGGFDVDRHRIWIFGLLLALGGAAAADASNGRYYLWDKNEDQQISRSEFEQGIQDNELHAAWDRDGDGWLNEREFGEAGFEGADFHAWDTDGDGRLNEDEMAAGLFEAFDDDRDGYWSSEELERAGRNEGLGLF